MLGKELISVVNTEIEEAQREAAKKVLKRALERMTLVARQSDEASAEYNRLLNLSVLELAKMDYASGAFVVDVNGIFNTQSR